MSKTQTQHEKASGAPETPHTGWAAINHVEKYGGILCKYADPIEGGRFNISVEEAREIAKEDCGLIYRATAPEVRATIAAGQFIEREKPR
jgi:hypothetical protein